MGLIDKIKGSLHGDKQSHEIQVARTEHGEHQGHHTMEDTTIASVVPVVPVVTPVVPSVSPVVVPDNHHHHHGKNDEDHHHHQDPVVVPAVVTPSVITPITVVEGEATSEIVHKDAILKHKHHHQEHTQVQPIVERDIIQPEIIQTIRPVHEKEADVYTSEEIVAPIIEEHDGKKGLIGSNTDELTHLTSELSIQAGEHNTQHVEHDATQEVLEPIIKETIHRHIIEQVQPVVHVERNEYHIKKVVQPVHQTVQNAPIVHEVQIKHESDELLNFNEEERIL